MSRVPALDQLCARLGVDTRFEDAWGREHLVAEETRRAVLKAMGVAAESDEAAERSLATLEVAEWRRQLAPVLVCREGAAALEVALALPQAAVGEPVQWVLSEESGGRREGTVRPADLALAETRQIEGRSWERRVLRPPMPAQTGYHRLEVRQSAASDAQPLTMTVIVAPARGYRPPVLDQGRRVWGTNAQLYALRSQRNWGIGDFTDLTRLVECTAASGADLVGVSPLHALFPHDPGRASPYGPSSRLFLNTLHLDVEAIGEFAECTAAQQRVADPAFQARLRALRAAELVDYPAVAELKRAVLELLYRHFLDHHLATGSVRAQRFEAFQHEQAPALADHVLYEALAEHLRQQAADHWGWPVWPEPYRDPRSRAVHAFAEAHRERVGFFAYLQWQAHLQLGGVGQRSLDLGVGLFQDLAVGVEVAGAEAWARQDVLAVGAHIGAPPDEFNHQGQDWGMLPWDPMRLRAQAYAPFITTLRHNMHLAGALRMDHIMALQRLYWIPAGAPPTAGAYVDYPLDDLLGIVALESQRNGCLVVGEDLGTVPPSLREAMARSGILSTRLLLLERDADGGFQLPARYPTDALAAVSTHDLPTLRGFWRGTDMDVRSALDLFSSAAQFRDQLIARNEARARLLLALDAEALLPEGTDVDPLHVPEMIPALVRAVHRYLARTPCLLMLVQLEDLLGQVEQVNLPGTTDEYPNWRRKLPLDLESWQGEAQVGELFAMLRAERGGAQTPAEAVGATCARGGPSAWIPRATYRVQLNATFTFDDAAAQVPYLADLGISHLYCSPYLTARAGSTHGYDVVNHAAINPELGGAAGLERLHRVLAEHDMGQILDMVPNHVGVMGRDNGWWLDVLEHGPASPYSSFFDIDWAPLKEALQGKVLVPVLGDYYGYILDRGELKLVFEADQGAFFVDYYAHRFPLDPREYPRILEPDIQRLSERLGPADPDLLAFTSLLTALRKLPWRSVREPAAVTERLRDAAIHKQRLAELTARSADLAWYVAECLRAFNGREGYRPDPARLHALLEAQAYRLAYWRVASDEINYRRFFDINDLAALRMENPEVFEKTHALVLQLIADGKVQALRIDHPDGLYDPGEYFRRLQRRVAEASGHPGAERPLYLLAEKILSADETLPADWPVHGTTGYDFANELNGLLVDAQAESAMTRIYCDFAGQVDSVPDELYRAKRLIMKTALASELNVLASEFNRITETDPHTRDFTLGGLRNALAQVLACFPVYRTYITDRGPSAADRANIARAVAEAKARTQAADLSIFDFVQETLLTTVGEGRPAAYRDRVVKLAGKVQQYTSPLMAKGVEDTAFYRYHRLVSLNEVGGDLERFGLSVEAFHRRNRARCEHWPHSLLATSTHDSKRSEDVRARLHVLTELPAEWAAHVFRWSALNASAKRHVHGALWPDRNTEYLLYQSLVGAWPLHPPTGDELVTFRARIQGYMEKAVREAKLHTSWINPDPEYEAALGAFIEAILDPERSAAFMADFRPFVARVTRPGLINGLAQTLLKLTAPGVPDLYQGNELWDFSLVDPDNRRPVDYRLRRERLAALQARLGPGEDRAERVGALLDPLEDGQAKLYLSWRALELRRQQPMLFQAGEYRPVTVAGRYDAHVCAFARRRGGTAILTVVPRLVMGWGDERDPLGEAVWADTALAVPAEHWENVLTGETLRASLDGAGWRLSVGAVLRHFPVGLLRRAECPVGER